MWDNLYWQHLAHAPVNVSQLALWLCLPCRFCVLTSSRRILLSKSGRGRCRPLVWAYLATGLAAFAL